MGLFQKLSGAANYFGRKIGAGAQWLGQKVSDAASAASSIASKIPGGALIGAGLNGVAGVGRSIVDAGKALVGGHGGLGGVSSAIQDGIAQGTKVLQSGNTLVDQIRK